MNLPKINGVDWEVAKTNLPEDGMIESAITEFIKKSGDDIDDLKSFWNDFKETSRDESFENYRIKVHALKNAAKLFGAMELSEEAKTLEFASRDRNEDLVDEGHEAFCKHYLDMAQTLASAFSQSTDNAEYDADALSDSLMELRMAMLDTDVETMNDIMDDISGYSYPEEIKKVIKKLEKAVLTLDKELFGEAVQELEAYL